MKTIFIFAAVLCSIAGILWLSDMHDKQMQTAAVMYEKCIIERYYKTPSAYRAEHGFYPLCK